MSISELCDIIPCWDMTEDEWLDARLSGIGGSEIGAIVGLSKYNTPFTVFQNKVNGINTFDGNEATDLGNHFEASVAEKYAIEKNAAVVEWPVILRSKQYEFLSANVDRFIVEPSGDFPAGSVTLWLEREEPAGIIGLLECKTGALASPGKPEEWDDNGIPIGYVCQGAWYGAATGLSWCDYAALIGSRGFLTRHMDIDPAFVKDLLDIGESFWYEHIVPGIPPETDGSDAVEEVLKAMYPEATPGLVYDGGDELLGAWSDFELAKAIAKQAEEDRKAARAKVLSLVGNAEVGAFGKQTLFTYRNNKPSIRLNEAKFKMEHPDVWEQYAQTVPGARVLRGKKT